MSELIHYQLPLCQFPFLHHLSIAFPFFIDVNGTRHQPKAMPLLKSLHVDFGTAALNDHDKINHLLQNYEFPNVRRLTLLNLECDASHFFNLLTHFKDVSYLSLQDVFLWDYQCENVNLALIVPNLQNFLCLDVDDEDNIHSFIHDFGRDLIKNRSHRLTGLFYGDRCIGGRSPWFKFDDHCLLLQKLSVGKICFQTEEAISSNVFPNSGHNYF